MLHVAAIALTMLAVSPTPTPVSALRVLVRVDAPATLRPTIVADALREARRIWRPYADLQLTTDIDPMPRGDEDLVRLSIVDRLLAASPVNRLGLGATEFVAPGVPRNTLTVSMAAIRLLTEQSLWGGQHIDVLPAALRDRFVTHALARAVAHEIGHYLLRSAAHADRGLMRANFSVSELMADGLRIYELNPLEVEALRFRQPVKAAADAPPKDRS